MREKIYTNHFGYKEGVHTPYEKWIKSYYLDGDSAIVFKRDDGHQVTYKVVSILDGESNTEGYITSRSGAIDNYDSIVEIIRAKDGKDVLLKEYGLGTNVVKMFSRKGEGYKIEYRGYVSKDLNIDDREDADFIYEAIVDSIRFDNELKKGESK